MWYQKGGNAHGDKKKLYKQSGDESASDEQDFSIFGKKEKIYKLYPKEKPEHIDTALEEFLTVGQDDEDDFDSSWDRFTKILASIIVEDMIANLGG